MKNYLKSTLYVLGVLWCMWGNINAMEIENPDENSMNIERKFEKLNIDDPHDLIYKLLTLKAEYLGEDLHREIEKIRPYIYEKVTEQDIKEFVQNYEVKLTDEQRTWPEKLKCTIYFDKDNKIDSRTLLIGEAYYPKELYLLPLYNVYCINYVNEQLGYSLKYNHLHALYQLAFSAEEYEVNLPEVFPHYHPFVTTCNLQVEFMTIYLPVKQFNFKVEYHNKEGSIDERKAFFLKLTSKGDQ